MSKLDQAIRVAGKVVVDDDTDALAYRGSWPD
jgi:hypothetical protein